ncbi:hypothetical protein LZD49_10840 [Dyadobacter sp. CY261]|uniref:hypothetical protein n=1 Tax=Dyadobacter sp. CY261 TaxID=2907203 RepID=UPI001F2F268C|nr:hypothetical protein [Dyadobacter sp. CY261]MCF0070970.1 hypothetical protein [Dyadobacter sp. CY261]
MKTRYCVVIGVAAAFTIAACKEKEVDSKFITVSSPKANQVINDRDSVIIEAVIKPEKTTVNRYTVTVKNKHDKTLFTSNRGCDCKSLSEVKLRESFFYDIDKTSDVFLEITAVLDDNSETREKVPFVLQDK